VGVTLKGLFETAHIGWYSNSGTRENSSGWDIENKIQEFHTGNYLRMARIHWWHTGKYCRVVHRESVKGLHAEKYSRE
jgi:hypothetical protein